MTRIDPNRVQAEPARDATSVVLEGGGIPAVAAEEKPTKAEKPTTPTSDKE